MELYKLVKILKWLPNILLLTSVGLYIFLLICYIRRFDIFSAVTAFPVWSWVIPGFLLTCFGSINTKKRYVMIVIALWITFVVLLADETKGIVRICFKPKPQEHTLRVISLNCAGGNYKAANEVISYNPDIVLLQETPTKEEITQLTKQLFGSEGTFVWEIDNAIIVKGKIVSHCADENLLLYSAQAYVQLNSGIKLKVISLRLMPPNLRFDLWSPDCWKSYTLDRKRKRLKMSAMAKELDSLPSETPVIIGGDFNAPAGDAIFFVLQPRLYDVFTEGGRGWGNTVMNDVPVHRFDQIWTSKHFKAVNVITQKTKYSDHRMVVADLMTKE